MEKHRSFSIKRKKFYLFFLTISFSILFLTFFSIWAFKTAPLLILQETHFQIQPSSLTQNSNSTQVLVKRFVNLNKTHFSRPLNSSETEKIGKKNPGFVRKSSWKKLPNLLLQKADAFNGTKVSDFTSRFVNLNKTHFSRPLNASETEKIQKKNHGFVRKSSLNKLPNLLLQKADAFNGTKGLDFTSRFVNLNKTHFSRPLNASESEKIGKKNHGFVRKSSLNKLPNLLLQKAGAFNGTKVLDFDVNSSVRNVDISATNVKEKDSRSEEKSGRVCDVTKGKWVFDESYPLYSAATCPFVDEGFSCEINGRLDKDYMKWRWKPQDCHIPRFNATNMLELIRGKRLVFVGDSINRNQWESMLCLLTTSIKDRNKVYETRGRRITKEKGNYSFKFVDYKCTIEYYVSHFLVRESKVRVGKKRTQTLRIDTVDRGSSRWKGADILIFNTAHWWSHSKTKSGINYYQEGDQVHPRLDVSTAFRKSMKTWASWVDNYINPRKTQVVFRSSAPSHFNGGEWNDGGHCKEASQPLNRTASINYPEKNIIVEEVIKQMKTPIVFLNVTTLSDYRIDGHPSVYGRKGGTSLRGQDCSHWCLPGVPDIWNQLLYFHLQSKVSNSFVQ